MLGRLPRRQRVLDAECEPTVGRHGAVRTTQGPGRHRGGEVAWRGIQALQVLRAVGGNRGRAASILGLSRKGLWGKLKAHGITNDEIQCGSDPEADDRARSSTSS